MTAQLSGGGSIMDQLGGSSSGVVRTRSAAPHGSSDHAAVDTTEKKVSVDAVIDKLAQCVSLSKGV